MDKLSDKVLVYDDACRACTDGSHWLIRRGFLDSKCRKGLSEIEKKGWSSLVDAQRAEYEIPLIDLAGGPTRYGVDALVFILQQKKPWIGRLYKLKPLKWIFRKLYLFISHNRRTISPVNSCSTSHSENN